MSMYGGITIGLAISKVEKTAVLSVLSDENS